MPPEKTKSNAEKEKAEIGDKRKHHEVEEKPAEQEGESVSEPPTKASKTGSPLEWLLSDEAFDLANPEIPEGHGEIDFGPGEQRKTPPEERAGENVGKHSTGQETILRYPQSELTPFQNLVSASILSKPLSHKLGLRTIQTLLNPPFSLRTLSDLDEAGYEGRRKVMWEARTQHKEKTASLLGDLCDGIKDLCGENEDDLSELAGVRAKIKGEESPEKAQEIVVETLTMIKGIGPGGAAIFLRRVQRDWPEVFPFIDDRSLEVAKEFGLVEGDGGAEQLSESVKGDRQKYVRLVDILVGIQLEKKLDAAIKKAGAKR